jgi:two-component system cell cycle sensor histidine kinase/response regulator CckA
LENFLKTIIFVLLSVLFVSLILIYSNTKSNAVLIFAIVSFFVLSLIFISQFSEQIFKFINKIKRKGLEKNKRYSDFKNELQLMDIAWIKFVENSPIPSITFDEKLNVSRQNKAFSELIKKNSLDNNTKNISDFFSCDIELYKEAMKKTEYSKSIEGEAVLRDAVQTPFIFFSAPINPDNENDKSYFAQFIDNSEQMDLKEKFIQAQKMQAIGQLAGGIAHDFNNLLTAIIGFSDLLLTKHGAGDPSFIDLMNIKQNANRAANLVRQLLAFSRKQTMQMEVLRINDVLAEISNLIRRLIGENINLELKIDRDVWDIKADKSQLDQVLINLAVNARDAMPNGGNLEINCYNKEVLTSRDIKFKFENNLNFNEIPAGKYVVISICDSGVGISQENLKKIFEPFFTTKEVGQGTGLGLATVSGIIEQTGGYIFVSSEEEFGTEFLIYLKKQDRIVSEIKEGSEKPKAKDLTGSGNILIVEDEEAVRIFSSRALKNKGYKVLEAFSGENALEVIEGFGADKIDLIISDVVMPGISGPEFVEQVLAKYPGIKVIFVSGYGEDAFYEKYGSAREFNFLAKPYNLNQLAEKVKDLLG